MVIDTIIIQFIHITLKHYKYVYNNILFIYEYQILRSEWDRKNYEFYRLKLSI